MHARCISSHPQVIGERIDENVKKIEFFRQGINDIRKSATKGSMRIVMGYPLGEGHAGPFPAVRVLAERGGESSRRRLTVRW